MADKFSELDLVFIKDAGMDIDTAFRVLMEKGITPDEMADNAGALFHSITEDVDKKKTG